ncbi:hypothetical protein JHK85_041143 [Glycine max]|nr:hypothetical protein JHK85_041143 [Glycine max]
MVDDTAGVLHDDNQLRETKLKGAKVLSLLLAKFNGSIILIGRLYSSTLIEGNKIADWLAKNGVSICQHLLLWTSCPIPLTDVCLSDAMGLVEFR